MALELEAYGDTAFQNISTSIQVCILPSFKTNRALVLQTIATEGGQTSHIVECKPYIKDTRAVLSCRHKLANAQELHSCQSDSHVIIFYHDFF